MGSMAPDARIRLLLRLAAAVGALLVVRTVLVTALNLRDYLPPNFESGFLLGREGYFFGSYRWPFYAHVVSGPLSLLGGLYLTSSTLRQRWPMWHRWIGKAQVLLVLGMVVPSGFWIAWYVDSPVARAGLVALAIATGWCAAMGWRSAIGRRFAEHQAWMTRCFALLLSAVVLRVVGGASEVLGATGTYPAAVWVSWLAPIAAVEWWRQRGQFARPTTPSQASRQPTP